MITTPLLHLLLSPNSSPLVAPAEVLAIVKRNPSEKILTEKSTFFFCIQSLIFVWVAVLVPDACCKPPAIATLPEAVIAVAVTTVGQMVLLIVATDEAIIAMSEEPPCSDWWAPASGSDCIGEDVDAVVIVATAVGCTLWRNTATEAGCRSPVESVWPRLQWLCGLLPKQLFAPGLMFRQLRLFGLFGCRLTEEEVGLVEVWWCIEDWAGIGRVGIRTWRGAPFPLLTLTSIASWFRPPNRQRFRQLGSQRELARVCPYRSWNCARNWRKQKREEREVWKRYY